MLNLFQGIGNLAKDVDVRQANDKDIATFTVCCDSGYGEHKHTEFMRCVAFGKLATVCGNYLQKGSKVYVSGPVKTRKWTDQNGVDRYSTELTVNEMKMLSPRGDTHGTHDEPDPMAGTGVDVPF